MSTIWLGLNHGDNPPLIFETATRHDGRTHIRERYATEAEALAGHENFVQLMRMELHNERARAKRAAEC